MAGVLIDTPVLVDAERDRKVLEQLPQEVRHSISVITVSELLHGVHLAAPDHVRIRRQVVIEALLGAIEQLPITSRIGAPPRANLGGATSQRRSHRRTRPVDSSHSTYTWTTLATANAAELKRVPALELLTIKSGRPDD